jgi:hypothetical protein
MSDIEVIVNLADQYAKHKWALRRILLSATSFEGLSNGCKTQFPDAEVLVREIDAIWFSRKNKGSETWEIRRIGSPPFALVDVVDDAVSADERENRLASLEFEMAIQGRHAREHKR